MKITRELERWEKGDEWKKEISKKRDVVENFHLKKIEDGFTFFIRP